MEIAKPLAEDRANAAAAQRQMSDGSLRPLLVHVHIPKCAGTSFNELLTRSYGDRHVPMYSTSPGHLFSADEFVQRVQSAPQAVAISSHAIRLFPRIVADRAMLYVMFLRDPLEWQVSNLTYLIAFYDQLSEAHRRTLPVDCPAMTVRELAAWLRARNLREQRPRSDVVNFLASVTAARLGVEPEQDRTMIRLAKHVTDLSFFTGVVERMSESIHRLGEKLKSIGLPLPENPAMPRLNSFRDHRGDLSWLNESDDLGKRVLQRLDRDRELYAHAVERLLHADLPIQPSRVF